MNTEWKRKLSSRKFWAMVAGFITGIIVFIQSPTRTPESIGGLIMSAGSLISYIIGEGIADSGDSSFTTNYNSPHIFGSENEEEEE